MSPPKSKRRAPSPVQQAPAKVARTHANGESKLGNPPLEPPAAEPKDKPVRKDSNLSALAPTFVPRSASGSASASTTSSVAHSPVLSQKTIVASPAKETQKSNGGQSTAPTSTQTTLTPALFRPIFKSEPIVIKDSTFQARLFRLENTNTQRTRILGHMKRSYDAQHHMAAWRCLILKDGMSGLEGEHAFVVDAGCCDDGESRGGKTVMDVLEKSGLCDVMVVVSRWFGGTMLGPARFTHIADCARAVCTAMCEQERENERKAKVADLVAQLREWDTEVTDLKQQVAALEPKKPSDNEAGDKENETNDTNKKPTVLISLKPPDYTNVLNPPDVEKAERLLQARRKQVQSLTAILDKKRQKPDDA